MERPWYVSLPCSLNLGRGEGFANPVHDHCLTSLSLKWPRWLSWYPQVREAHSQIHTSLTELKKKKKYVFYILPMLQNRLRKVLKCNSIYIRETYSGSRWRQWNKEKQGHTLKMKPSMSLGHNLLSAGLPEAPRASSVSPVLSACMVFWCWFHHADPTPSHWLTAPCSQPSISALAVFLQLWHAQESSGELVKNPDCWAPLPEFFIQQV